MTAKNYADMVVSMDADLQDDINAVDEMVEKYLNGIDIVYGVRSSPVRRIPSLRRQLQKAFIS